MKLIRLSAEEFTNSEASKDLKATDTETYKRKMRMLPSLESILLNANVNWQSPDFKNHNLYKENGFENYREKVRIDNIIFNTVVIAGKARFGDVFYDINLEVDQILPHGETASEIKRSTSADNSIPNNSETVKENVAESESDTQKSIPSENVRHNQERYLKCLYKSWGLTKYIEEDLKADIKDLRHAVSLYGRGGQYRKEAVGILSRLAERALSNCSGESAFSGFICACVFICFIVK